VPAAAFYALLFALTLAFRLAHVNILWVEEGYPLAAAAEMLRGHPLYAAVWFDKPPLFPGFYLLFGAAPGLPLRVAGALFVTLSAWSLGRLARHLWSEKEERLAAALTAFFLTFGIPATVMVIGPDLMLIPIQAAAVLAAWRRQPLPAGLLAGFGLLLNGKMLLFLPAVFVASPLWLLGLAAPQLILLPYAQPYWQQVWAWAALYSRDTFVANPFLEGLQRTANWAGFHCAAVLAALLALKADTRRLRFALWLACAAVALVAGFRFAPRYYFLLLPPVLILAARGLALRPVLALLLLIPAVRFGPRYVELAADNLHSRPHQWRDLAMEQDSRAAAAILKQNPGTLLVWGYRPEIYPLSGLPAATPFLDSQPLTGVLADRHLTVSTPTAPDLARANRALLLQTRPDWIVDGLGPYNPDLAIARFPDLQPWLAHYTVAARTAGSVLYRRQP
jgi:hypothetical protein